MKITRTEKRWLITVLGCYVLYNLPLVPDYGDAKGLMLHAVLTLIPLWISVYAGLMRIFRRYRLRKKDTSC